MELSKVLKHLFLYCLLTQQNKPDILKSSFAFFLIRNDLTYIFLILLALSSSPFLVSYTLFIQQIFRYNLLCVRHSSSSWSAQIYYEILIISFFFCGIWVKGTDFMIRIIKGFQVFECSKNLVSGFCLLFSTSKSTCHIIGTQEILFHWY